MSARMWVMGFIAALLVIIIVPSALLEQPGRKAPEDYSRRQMADAKERECELDRRCASYNRSTGEWLWKPGQQPAPEPIIIKLTQ